MVWHKIPAPFGTEAETLPAVLRDIMNAEPRSCEIGNLPRDKNHPNGDVQLYVSGHAPEARQMFHNL